MARGLFVVLGLVVAAFAQVPGRPSWKQVEQATTVDALRHFRGDFGGIYLDAIKPQCPADPLTDVRCPPNARGLANGALFTPAYAHYTSAQRAAIRAAYTSRGYTHFPIGIFTERRRSYHDTYPPGPTGGDVSPYLEELWADGIYPVCFVLQDHETAADAERNAARLTDRDLCRIVVPKWEMNDPDANDTARMNAEILATRAAFPDAQLYVHFTARRTAAGPPEDAWWGDGWRKGSMGHADDWPGASHAFVRGLLYQDDGWNDPDAVIDRLGGVLVQLAGFDVVLFETDIYPKFWQGRTEEQGRDYNDKILRARMLKEACLNGRCGRLTGFTSGGSVKR